MAEWGLFAGARGGFYTACFAGMTSPELASGGTAYALPEGKAAALSFPRARLWRCLPAAPRCSDR